MGPGALHPGPKDREGSGFGRKLVSGGWKWEAGAERLGERLLRVNEWLAVPTCSWEVLQQVSLGGSIALLPATVL